MPLSPEPVLLYMTVTAVGYALLWRWTTVENGDVELSYAEDRLRDAEDSSGRRGDAEISFRDE